MKPKPSEATMSVMPPRSRSGLKVTWSMPMHSTPIASAAVAVAGRSGQPSCALSAKAM
jgi:hypothetical protein